MSGLWKPIELTPLFEAIPPIALKVSTTLNDMTKNYIISLHLYSLQDMYFIRARPEHDPQKSGLCCSDLAQNLMSWIGLY